MKHANSNNPKKKQKKLGNSLAFFLLFFFLLPSDGSREEFRRINPSLGVRLKRFVIWTPPAAVPVTRPK